MPKASKNLTDYAIKTLRPNASQAGWKTVTDGACRGLALRLSPRGEKVWAVRHTLGDRRSYQTIGAYPSLSLADARRRAEEYQSAAREGLDAAAVEKRKRAMTMTVAEAHAEYMAGVEGGLRPSTLSLKRSIFANQVEPVIGSRQIRNIRRADVIEVVKAAAGKGHRVQANRVFSEVMALLRWCEEAEYRDGVPALRKRSMRSFGAAREVERTRVLSDDEVKAAWHASAGIGRLSRDFIRLLLLTGQRRDEVRKMAWEEVDMKEALWVIPGFRYKTHVDVSVPLSRPAMDILRARWSEGATGYVLPGRGEGKPFNGSLSAHRRLVKALPGCAPFILHDLRRTLRTGLSRLKVTQEVAELVIGHMPPHIVRVYDAYYKLDERREALELWGCHLMALVAPVQQGAA